MAYLFEISGKMFITDATETILPLSRPDVASPLDGFTQPTALFTIGLIGILCFLFLISAAVARRAHRRAHQLNAHLSNQNNFLDDLGFILFDIDRNGLWHHLSAGWENVTGYRPTRSIGQAASHIVHPDDKINFNAFIDAVLKKNQTPQSATFRIVKNDGAVRFLHFHVCAILDDHDTVAHLKGTAKDVTNEQQHTASQTHELEKLREKSALLEIALENINQGIMMVDADGSVTVVNHRAIELLGLPPEIADTPMQIDQILRYQWSIGEFGDTGEHLEPWLRKLMESRQHILDMPTYERRRPNGCVLEIQTKTLTAGGAVRTFSDITHRKHIEMDLARARDLAEAASRMRSEFLAIMSHEIRSPLNGILGLIAILTATTLDREQTDHVSNLRESGEKLLETVSDILDFAKLDADLLSLDNAPFDPTALCETVVSFLTPKAHQRQLEIGLYISPDVPGCVIGDSMRLRQILLKLVGNAIKFTHTGGVMIEVTAKPGNAPLEQDLRFSVRDTGIGVPQGALSSLFQEFFQFDRSALRRFSGTGLGLAICKKLVDLMRGTIYVESTELKGSVFHVGITTRLPQDTVSLLNQPLSLEHATLLLVDNNVISQKYISQPLLDAGADLEITTSISQAVKYISTSSEDNAPFNAVIFNMSENINSFIERINIKKLQSNLTIFALCNQENDEKQTVFNELIKIIYIKKPVNMKKIIKNIENIPIFTKDVIIRSNQSLGKGRRILLAEDDATNQLITSTMLHHMGFTVDCAENGTAVLAALHKTSYDLIVMDVMMPEMDGLDTTKAIRAMTDARRNIPILALTANAFSHDAALCYAAGMNDFATKPITRTQLETRIRTLLDNASPDKPAPDQPSGSNEATERPLYDPTKVIQLIVDISSEATQSILANFQLETDKRLRLFKEIIQNQDYARLAREAHSLKSSAATVGFLALSHEAAMLEHGLATQNRSDLTAILDRLNAAFRGGCAEADQHHTWIDSGDKHTKNMHIP